MSESGMILSVLDHREVKKKHSGGVPISTWYYR